MPKFTNYHQPYIAAWRQLFGYAKWNPDEPHTVVEVGSYEGSSAWWIMQNLLKSPASRLYCIDAWQGEGMEERFALFSANIAELANASQVEVMRDWSQNALRELVRRGVKADLLYVDGAHDAPTVLRDLVTGFDLVKVGGLVICDDYLWADPRFGGSRTLGRPKIALDAFTTIYAEKIAMLQGLPNLQVYFQKTAD
jgi:predicted O-methyltransferase YrrM